LNPTRLVSDRESLKAYTPMNSAGAIATAEAQVGGEMVRQRARRGRGWRGKRVGDMALLCLCIDKH
jgi:hypothetical protein